MKLGKVVLVIWIADQVSARMAFANRTLRCRPIMAINAWGSNRIVDLADVEQIVAKVQPVSKVFRKQIALSDLIVSLEIADPVNARLAPTLLAVLG